jgi:hypothetical protein
MGRVALRQRAVWQDQSGPKATTAEQQFFAVFKNEFQNTPLRMDVKPRDFINMYLNVPLDPNEAAEIYNPLKPINRHGIIPEGAIRNIDTKKSLYVELKRQDGWVEGGKRSDGRGNAHERLCKYFAPGLREVISKEAKLGDQVLPVWFVFLGNICCDPCRVREIRLWFGPYSDHVFFWRDPTNEESLLEHFYEKLQPLLW